MGEVTLVSQSLCFHQTYSVLEVIRACIKLPRVGRSGQQVPESILILQAGHRLSRPPFLLRPVLSVYQQVMGPLGSWAELPPTHQFCCCFPEPCRPVPLAAPHHTLLALFYLLLLPTIRAQ